MDAYRNLKDLANFDFTEQCYDGEPILLKAPVHDKMIAYNCDGHQVGLYNVTVWLGVGLKSLTNISPGCPLYVGVTETTSTGQEWTHCKKFCEEGQRIKEVLYDLAPLKALDELGNVADIIAQWVENETETEAQSEVIFIGIITQFILISIMAVGISVVLTRVGVFAKIARALYRLLRNVVRPA